MKNWQVDLPEEEYDSSSKFELLFEELLHDQSSNYKVKFNASCTVREFVKEVLDSQSERIGSFEIVENGNLKWDTFKFEYGGLLDVIPESILSKTINTASVNAGWYDCVCHIFLLGNISDNDEYEDELGIT